MGMTDKELLELAAKAAGIEIINSEFLASGPNLKGSMTRWNPLSDDGDALRLAVKLNLAIQQLPGAYAVEAWHGYECARESYGDTNYSSCPYAATRRAIVRAAAEIGKNIS
jgi:hypothetical protein